MPELSDCWTTLSRWAALVKFNSSARDYEITQSPNVHGHRGETLPGSAEVGRFTASASDVTKDFCFQ